MRAGAVAGAVLAAALAAGPASAQAAVSVRIDAVRVLSADTRRPAAPPYLRTRAYRYEVRYRVAGERLVRVTRRAEIRIAGGGTLIARVAPPTSVEEPGRYAATAPITVGRRAPPAVYVLRYAVTVRGRSGRASAVRTVRLRFV